MPKETDMERILREARASSKSKERLDKIRESVKKNKPGSKPAPKQPAPRKLAPKGPGVSADRAGRLLGGRARQIDALVESAVRGEVDKLKDRQTTDKNN